MGSLTRQRSTHFALLLGLFVCTARGATRVHVEPPPPFYADERVQIRLETDVRGLKSHDFDITGDNISIVPLAHAPQALEWWGSFYATSGSGQIVVRGPGEIEPSRIPFTILPPLIQPWTDPGAELRRLITANRPPIIIRAELRNPSPVVVGQRVKVVWYLYHPVDGPSYDLGVVRDEKAQALNVETFFGHEPPEMVPLGGFMLWRKNALRMTFTPREAGRITIPSLTFSSGGIRRVSTPLELDVREIPAGSERLPVGPFTMQCEDYPARPGYWPRLSVHVRGGSIQDVRQFEFGKTPYGVITKGGETYGDLRIWGVVAHSRKIEEMPSPRLRFFDPSTDAPMEVGCTETIAAVMSEKTVRMDLRPVLYKRGASHSPQQHAREDEHPPDPAELRNRIDQGRRVSFVLAAIALLGLILAFRA